MEIVGRSEYFMTGSDGSTSCGWWRFVAVEPARLIEVEDGFANDDGTPNDTMPSMRMAFTFEPTATGSRFTSVTHFPSTEAMQQLLEMGMEEACAPRWDSLMPSLLSPPRSRRSAPADRRAVTGRAEPRVGSALFS